METYTLPREALDMLEESLGGKERAEILAKTLETAIGNMQQRTREEILEQKQLLKIALKDDLKMNIFIAIALIALTFANPAFVELIKKIF